MNQVIQHTWGRASLLSLPNTSANLIFADPPYNQKVKYDGDETNDNLSNQEYLDLTVATLNNLYQFLKPGGTLWWMIPERWADQVGTLLSSMIGPRLYRIVWHETFAQYQETCLTRDYRFIFAHQKEGGDLTFNPNAIRIPSDRQEKYKDKRANPAGRVPGTVWKVRRLQGTSDDRVSWHPTQLPPELLERIVLGFSNPGDLIVDAFAGSGTMGLACKKHGRDFLGVDRSESYVRLMKERLGIQP